MAGLSQIEALIGEIETLPKGDLRNNLTQQAAQLYQQYEQDKAATEAKGKEQAKTYGAGGAIAEKALDQLTAGHGAEIQAGLQSLIPKEAQHLVQAPISEIVPALFSKEQYASLEKKYPGGDYTQLRDEIEARLRGYKESSPTASKVGNVLGFLAGAKGLSKIAGVPANLAQAAKQGTAVGAGMGLLQDPGTQYGEIAPIQASERMKNAAIGAAGGLLLSPVAYGAGKLLEAGASKLKDYAAKKAIKAAGRFTPNEQMAIPEVKQIAMGKKILEEKVIGNIPKSQQTILNRVSENVDKTGKQLGNLVDEVSQTEGALQREGYKVGVDKQQVAKELANRLIDETESGSPTVNAAVAKEVDHFLNAPQGKGPEGMLSIKETQGLLAKVNQKSKGILDKVRRNGYESLTDGEKVLLEKQDILRDAVTDAAEGVAKVTNQPSLAADISATKQSYHLNKLIEQAAKREMGRELARNNISLAPKIAAFTSNDPITGLIKGMALQATEDYGPQLFARQLYNASNLGQGLNTQSLSQPAAMNFYDYLRGKK